MRTKPSNTANQPGTTPELQQPKLLQYRAAQTFLEPFAAGETCSAVKPFFSATACATAEEDEGLLHDARNLIGAVGLYCDLLSMPHVLDAEHRHYADELRLLSERGAAMIERLIESRANASVAPDSSATDERTSSVPYSHRPTAAEPLRPVVERCAGLLGRIAEEHCMEIAYGDAAALPVRVPAESVERILINLVRNAAAALKGMRGSIRISVGELPGNSGGRLCPWPFQRVRLTVEDSGRGMGPAKVQHLMEDRPSWFTRHGIGFHVVRELVEASGGELTISSQLGRGTQIEMEWPIAQLAEQDRGTFAAHPMGVERRGTA